MNGRPEGAMLFLERVILFRAQQYQVLPRKRMVHVYLQLLLIRTKTDLPL